MFSVDQFRYMYVGGQSIFQEKNSTLFAWGSLQGGQIYALHKFKSGVTVEVICRPTLNAGGATNPAALSW